MAWAGANTLVEPVCRTLLLRPQVLRPEWDTSNSGIYARLGLSGYQMSGGGALDPTKWATPSVRFDGDIFLQNRGVNEPVFVVGTQPVNKPFHIALWIPEGQGQSSVTFQCGWGEPGNPATIALKITSSGRVEIYKGANLVGDGNIAGASVDMLKVTGAVGPGQSVVGDQATPGAGNIAGSLLSLYLIPCRRRELLIFSSHGGGLSHVFDDLDPESVNTITPSGRFWWFVPAGHASVQCVPMVFPTSGYALGPIYNLREPPLIGEVLTILGAFDAPGYGGGLSVAGSLTQADGATAFVPDGVSTQARIRINLTGDGSNTPFVYAADAVSGSYIESTDGSEQADLSDYLTDFSFSVTESPDGVSGTMELRGPQAIAEWAAGIGEQSSRPFRLEISDDGVLWRMFVEGFIEKPKSIEAAEFRDELGNILNDRAKKIVLPWRDKWVLMEDFRYEDEMPALDAGVFTNVMAIIPQDAGFPGGEVEVEARPFTFPYNTSVSRGEWSEPVPYGSSAAELTTRLWRDYAASWYLGGYPTISAYVLRFRSELTLPGAAQAVATLADDSGAQVIREWEEETIPPEVTRVTVVGYDPRLRSVLRYRDGFSPLEIPGTVPSGRPAGWSGTPKPLFVSRAEFTTQDAVQQAAEELLLRLGTVRKVAAFSGDLLKDAAKVPLWRGSAVGILGKGLYRIEALSGSLKYEAVDFTFRNIRYVARRIGDFV